MDKTSKSFFELETPEFNIESTEEIAWIEKEILKSFRIKNFQLYLNEQGLSGFYKDLVEKIKRLLRHFMYYNILMDLNEEQKRLIKIKNQRGTQ